MQKLDRGGAGEMQDQFWKADDRRRAGWEAPLWCDAGQLACNHHGPVFISRGC